MLTLQHIAYLHSNKDLLFDNINLTINRHDKVALIGNNGTGKSTLLKLMAGVVQPSHGSIKVDATPYYVPQLFGQFNNLNVAQALRVDDKLRALREILDGNVTEDNLALLNDDWTIEERCYEALSYWQLNGLDLTQPMQTLSGGQKTKVFLAGIAIHQPDIVLLDEPSNHLDVAGRQALYDFIESSAATLVVVSHDRKLLNLLDQVYELSRRGIAVYGGNYDFYVAQKTIESHALSQDIHSREKALRKAREIERETAERKQKLDARGKKKQEKAGVSRIMMNTLRNSAENSTSRLKSVHTEKIGAISEELSELRKELPDTDKLRFGFDNSALHRGKILFSATDINFGYADQFLWSEALRFQLTSGERIALKGLNGSGKTTLIKIILGELESSQGTVYRADNKSVYIDQDYSLIDNALTVHQQAQRFNVSALQEHEIKIRLNRFLFTKDDWDKSCVALSGGEKMRLMLCCLTIGQQSPDIIVLDEPTNNLDIQSVDILTAAINEYQGTLIVVAHDESFLEEINTGRTITLV
ncbi:ABC-F family ATP-binding cassette domain-containing protein [Spirosoma validum]|uniref:ABC-F family ATP-binding cassette domain-containing protein n=1 Tax=Spirosoma validum TaxID=2771355 RepID=A0A927B213_9BACT|nr:ABC-F family ATP-binding cassette domain-containing protein [Spirosoma validum]MBD2754131.1 ABC-F family ATP-binding cassette domain-containing protein [Spirosoma validum]